MTSPDYPEGLPTVPSGVICPDCGKELRLVLMPPYDFPIPLPCECLKIKVRHEREATINRGKEIIRAVRRKEAGIEGSLAEHNFDSMTAREGQEVAFRIAKAYSEKVYTQAEINVTYRTDCITTTIPTVGCTMNRRGLIITGSTGSGKTMLAAAIGNVLIDETYIDPYEAELVGPGGVRPKEWSPVRMAKVVDMLADIKSGYDNGTAQETIDRFKAVRLAILDDLGAERPTEWAVERLFEIVDARYVKKLPMVVTTNCTPADLSAKLGSRIVDRLYEMCAQVTIKAGSQRRASI